MFPPSVGSPYKPGYAVYTTCPSRSSRTNTLTNAPLGPVEKKGTACRHGHPAEGIDIDLLSPSNCAARRLEGNDITAFVHGEELPTIVRQVHGRVYVLIRDWIGRPQNCPRRYVECFNDGFCLPSAIAAVIVSACTSKPKYRVFLLMTDSSFVALRLSFFAETERNPRLRRESVVPS